MALYSAGYTFNLVGGRLANYQALFVKHGQRRGVAPEALAALGAHESNGDPSVIGPTNANGTRDYGLMQVNESNYAGDPADLLDPDTNVQHGADIFADAVKQAGGDVLWAISAYNRGFRATYNGQALTKGRLPSGAFPNQAYVDDVRAWFTALRTTAGKPTDLGTVTEAGIADSPLVVFLLLGILATALFRALFARHH